MTVVSEALLAADLALPLRDILLDPVAAPVPIDADAVDVVRCKYRVGESLRVLYRCTTAGGERLVSVRATVGRPLRWWTFPDDRRLPHLDALLAPAAPLVAMAGGRGWVRSEVVEYAPERSVTVRAVDTDGRATAYVKQYAPGMRDVPLLAARYDHLTRYHPAPRTPRLLGWSGSSGTLVLEAIPGARMADGAPATAVATAAALGRAIAALHTVPAPVGTPPFGRLGQRRLERATDVVARVRPDLAAAVHALARRFAEMRDRDAPVLVHGDCHPKNAIVAGTRLTLIDLDQAGRGAAATDIGSLLARVRVAGLVGTYDPSTGTELADAFLAGYAEHTPLPAAQTIRWHTAAALLVEQALRAVNRVRPDVLAQLPAVLDAAAELLPPRQR